MRIIAGKYRGRRLKSLAGLSVRPTPDRLRESLFNVLAPEIQGSVFLDAYAGTGAVAFEALSRGASRVMLFEQSAAALTIIRENASTLGLGHEAIVIRGRALQLYAKHPADIVFVDPPYNLAHEYADSLLALAQTSSRLVIAQHSSKVALDNMYAGLSKTRVLRQGDNSLSFFRPSVETYLS